MHRIPSNTICVMSALCLGASAVSAEPIVAILPEQTTEVVLTDLDEGFPQARLFSFESYDGNPQLYLLYPGLVQLDENGQGVFPPFEQFDSVAGGPIDPGYWGPGLVLPNDTAPNAWARASGFLDFRPQLPSLAWYSLEQAEFCGIVGCSTAYPDGDIEITEIGGVLSMPLRQYPTTPEQYRYGWVAFRRVEYSPSCAADQSCDSMLLYTVEFLAVGFETAADTPITVGGGACLADVNLDAVLDLSDVQAFVAGFVNQTGDGDVNGDGIYDLADIQVFISDFNNCGLL